MKRIQVSPRKGYTAKIEELGFSFHEDYWKEDSYYEITSHEVDLLEQATVSCYQMYLDAVQHVIDNDLWEKLQIPESIVPKIKESWIRDDLSLYGRFDFALENGIPKLLEFNADTPTSLLEASIIQWGWARDHDENSDQFNSIHENLVQSFKDINKEYRADLYHFAYLRDNDEDSQTVRYLMECAQEAGLSVADIDIEQLSYQSDTNCFLDPGDSKITHCFKLYPFEWMMDEDPEGVCANIIWIEPLWKSVMSNKALLPIIYKLFFDSEYILPTYFEDEKMAIRKSYCRKPVFSREGANVKLVKDGSIIEETDGIYLDSGYIYQRFVDLEKFDNKYPIIGSWIIGGVPAGMGIRENDSRITHNRSTFVPHVIID